MIGNSDTHLAGQMAVPHTVVRSPELSRAAILAAIRAGRSWIAGSGGVALSLTAAAGGRVARPGEHLTAAPGAEIQVRADIRGVPGGTVTLHTEHGPAHRAELPSSGAGSIGWTTGQGRTALVRLEVRHPDTSMAALTNAVRLN